MTTIEKMITNINTCLSDANNKNNFAAERALAPLDTYAIMASDMLSQLLPAIKTVVDPAYWKEYHEDGVITCIFCYNPHSDDCPVAIFERMLNG